MHELRGWLFDVYAHPQSGLTIWMIGEDDRRYAWRCPFLVTIHAAGPFPRLRALWRWLQTDPAGVHLARTAQNDLFTGRVDALSFQVDAPKRDALFNRVRRAFPDLTYYNADVPLAVHFAAAYGVYPLTRCRVAVVADQVVEVQPLDSRWDIDIPWPPLRLLAIAPDVDPGHAPPQYLIVKMAGKASRLPLRPERDLLVSLRAKLKRYDPDILLTQWGDTWLLPYLLAQAQKLDIPLPLSRDKLRVAAHKQERSYFTYGQVIHRGQQVHLFGRWHIDRHNAIMFNQYDLAGVIEQARVSAMPAQEMARRSPGAGITAMQMLTAFRRGVLVPFKKQQAERFKSARALIRADRGGLVYQPLIGVHGNVVEIDFVSMYPAIIERFNISPETIAVPSDHMAVVPELDMLIDQEREGLLPETLRPLLHKRVAIKSRLATMDARDCRYAALKARATALKWLLVVAFGYAGYKNARFGRIEAHEAITTYSREAMLLVKEMAETAGYELLHAYVDGLWLRRAMTQRMTSTPAEHQPLLDSINDQLGLPIAMEGIYNWIVFLPSKLDARVPVPNRYFGAFQDGSLKIRGIEARRRDTPAYVARVQLELLKLLARIAPAARLPAGLPPAIELLQERLAALRAGRVPLPDLLVSQGLSRVPEEYKVPSPVARAALQLERVGKAVRPGMRLQFLYTREPAGVYAWNLPAAPDPEVIDRAYYQELLLRAAATVLCPLGMAEAVLRDVAQGRPYQLALPFPGRW